MNNEKVTSNAKSAVCSNCGGQLNIDGQQDIIECPYCGTKFPINELIDESDAVRVEKIKQQTYKDIELEKLEHEKEKNKKQEDKDNIQSFKKSKFSKVLIIFAVLSALFCAVAFKNGVILSGIIALIQVVLFTGSWLMGMQIINEPKKGMRVLSAVIAFVLIIPFFSFYNLDSSRVEKFDWNDMELGTVIPEPKSNVGEIISNSSTSLSIYVHKTSKSDYKDYVSECEAMGFTVEAEKSDSDYSAFNEDGYKLALYYYESNEKLSIDLDAPLEMSEFQWPNSAIAKLLPVPKSNIGNVSWENSEGFLIKIGNTSIDDFKAYVDECAGKGFTVDYQKGDDYYYADDSSGNHISLKYEGNNIMSVDARVAEDVNNTDELSEKQENEDNSLLTENSSSDESSEKQENEDNSSSAEISSSTEVSAEFKAAMDSYEKFFDEYVDITKKYANNPNDMSILADYTKYMGQYADTMQKFNDVQNEDLSIADAAYYAEVQGRVTKKLLEVAQ